MTFGWTGEIAADISAYRSVSASQTFFHDAPTTPPRAAYVQLGDTVEELGENSGSFTRVRYEPLTPGQSTLGFVSSADLFSLPAGSSPGL
jgi:hypothetical protein